MLFRPAPRDEVDAEIAFHVEMETRRLIQRGMPRTAAREAALQRFGDLSSVRRECTELAHQLESNMRRAELVDEIRQDVRFGMRLLRRTPLFTVMALLTLAIGVGAVTTIFSVVEAVLLRGLPYPNAGRMVVIANSSGPAKTNRTAVAAAEFADYQSMSRTMDAVAAVRPSPTAISGGCDAGPACGAEQITAYAASPDFLTMLGAKTVAGRGLQPADTTSDAPLVAVLSYALWQRRYAGDTSVVGRTITLGGRPRIVVGVLASSVRFPDAPVAYLRDRADVWVPVAWEQFATDSRGNQYLAVFGRMRPGSTMRDVRGDFDAIAARFRQDYPDRYTRNPNWHIAVSSMLDDMVGDARPVLLLLFASVGVILMLACANIATLMLARGEVRARELAVRAALGAGRRRIAQQLLTESVVLAIGGGALGVLLAVIAVPRLAALDPGGIPRFETASIDVTVLAFSLAVALGAGAMFGLVPAFRFSETDLHSALGFGARSITRLRRRARNVLISAEVGLAVIVLVMSGLLVRTVVALHRVPVGVETTNVTTFRLSLPALKYDSAYKRAAFQQQVQDALGAIPGVTAAAGIYPLPMSGDGWSGSYDVEGQEVPGAEPPHAEYAVSLPGYPAAMGIRLLDGRDFTLSDVRGAPTVVMVDETLAHKHWPTESAVGKRLNPNGNPGQWATVIGVVGHVRNAGPVQESEPQIYLPALQRPQSILSFLVRGQSRGATAREIGDAVSSVDRDVPVAQFRPMGTVVAGAISRQRFLMQIFLGFGLTALGLAAVGLYGVMGYLVTQRSQEIGVRMALGGTRGDVLLLVMREALGITFAGVGVGLAGALVATRFVSHVLFGVTPADVPTYVTIVVVLTLVAVIAAWGPARRAMRVDPVDAIRG
jgi:predicted permease